jgi:ribosomal protein S18 acetylase RimI-like enzyme
MEQFLKHLPDPPFPLSITLFLFSALPFPSRHAGRGGWLCDLERMRKECGDHEEPKFKYQSPESANVGMITYFLGNNGELQKDLRMERMAELEVLGVKPGHQRKRIGALLLEEGVKEVCKILF